jgi:hypothetical protein
MFEISAIPFDGGYEVTVTKGDFKGCICVGCKTEEEATLYANEVFIPDLLFNFPELREEEPDAD